MWINATYNQYFQQEFSISRKLLESQGQRHTVEIFEGDCGEIALFDGEYLLLKDWLFVQSELLAHIPACSSPNVKRVLIVGSFNIDIATQFLQYEDVKIDFLQFDIKVLESLISFFPKYTQTFNHKNFNHIPQSLKDFILQNQQRVQNYDIIIAQMPLSVELNEVVPLLDKEGILVLNAPNPFLDFQKLKDLMLSLSDFRILMPFYAPLSLLPYDFYLFASYKYHPTADICLQKADMLEGLEYYNALLHQSAFVLPQRLKQSLVGIAKN